ncbi:leucine-rich repeat and coiled-coil domain-containing protein 1 isoform X2 [Melopsittacus undulatus]|uniref:leucine-rich repeat and coiled-coil domain-containing protein 1 isoform X2 n=1 Tax=Melopsittacus undulatus TaxID=13146 RepID=UPI00146D8036|nr:leucine-rich repeat and coiled-coil domain-containing protein 1 isoform X2 [Melopsittacus undulatus]
MEGERAIPGELYLVDKGIQSLLEVSLSSELHTLNVHCNRITRMEGLGHLRNLQHLDLSSNQIRRIEGLSSLANLRTLSLSCNLITKVEGLEKLYNLTMLNLSYNHIHDLSGFQCLHGTSHKISHIDLHSNCVNNINHLVQCTKGLCCLTHLTLEKNGKANPVCHTEGYREIVLQMLPQLTALDGRNTSGEPVDPAEKNRSDLQGLEDIWSCLVSPGCPSSKDQNYVNLPVVTPHIDQALAHFRQRTKMLEQNSISSSIELVSSSEAEKAELDKIYSEMRIKKMEDQISQILQKVSDTSGREAPPTVLKAKRDTDPTSESENESRKEKNRKVTKRSKLPTYHRTTLSTRCHAHPLKNKVTDREEKSSSKCSYSSQRDSHLSSSSDTRYLEIVGKKAEMLTGRQNNIEKVEEINSNATEESTYRVLIQELDQEKERRWKAEQAEKKLIEHVRELKKHAKEEKSIQSMAVYTTDRLKELILKERNIKARLQADVQQLKGETERLTNELNQARNKEAEYQKAMQALEQTLSKMETQQLQQRTTEMKQVQEAELKASANEREVQLLRISFRQQKEKVKQLHELLILREQEQRKELETRVALNGPEFQDALSKAVAKEEQRHEQHVKEFQEKINTLNQKYKELEDEFRLALIIEGKKFKEVKEGFENVTADLAEHKQAVFEFEQKEKEMKSVIQDLTSIVKEQKAKIADLTKANEEATANLKGLQEKDKQIRKQHEETLKAQKCFQVQLDEKAAEFEELLEKLERQNGRKEELKQLLEEKEVELDDIKDAYSALKMKWQGKEEILSQLEVQVKRMKENFDIKEKKLIEERDKSLQTQRIAVEKLQEMDDAFRKQLGSMLIAHQEELLQLATEKEKQIEAANEKVYCVEEEMRQLLQEMANHKKAMENKIRRLTHALNDFQQDL